MVAHVFIIQVEVTHMEGTQLPADCAGAIVNAYIGAHDIRDAINRVEAELLEDCYQPVFIFSAGVLDIDEADFDDEEGYPELEDLIRIQASDEIWYGPFNVFPPEQHEIH